MSRSRKKTPISGITCAESEKADKKIWHSRLRAKTRIALKRGDEILPEEDDASNPYLMAKDGKNYYDGDNDGKPYRRRMK